MIIVRPLIDVLGKIMKLPKNSYLDPTTLGSGTPSSSTVLYGDSTWKPGPPSSLSYGLFAQTSNSPTLTGTTAEGTLIDGGVGTLSVPANGFNVGDSFRAEFGGLISSKNNDTIRIRVKAGSIILADSGPFTMPSITNQVWLMSINFTIRSLGGPGVSSIVTLGNLHVLKLASGTQEGFGFNSINNTTFDTTISNTLNVTAQFSSSSGLNSIYSDIFVLNKIY